MIQPQKRIKPKLLREQKTEALLVFIRTTLEEYFEKLDKGEIFTTIGDDEESILISNILRNLLLQLQECVVSSSYLRSIIANVHKNATLKILAKQEEPLMVYYDSLVKGLEHNLKNGQKWMPELMVLCLLSEWIIEEEKSVFLYPFLNDINYLQLLEIYDKTKLTSDDFTQEIILNMYKISSNLIANLFNSTYKINTTRKRKKRK
ncbi:MAG: hypothetical protein WC149_03080 [Arcobacteraceae bacterium]